MMNNDLKVAVVTQNAMVTARLLQSVNAISPSSFVLLYGGGHATSCIYQSIL